MHWHPRWSAVALRDISNFPPLQQWRLLLCPLWASATWAPWVSWHAVLCGLVIINRQQCVRGDGCCWSGQEQGGTGTGMRIWHPASLTAGPPLLWKAYRLLINQQCVCVSFSQMPQNFFHLTLSLTCTFLLPLSLSCWSLNPLKGHFTQNCLSNIIFSFSCGCAVFFFVFPCQPSLFSPNDKWLFKIHCHYDIPAKRNTVFWLDKTQSSPVDASSVTSLEFYYLINTLVLLRCCIKSMSHSRLHCLLETAVTDSSTVTGESYIYSQITTLMRCIKTALHLVWYWLRNIYWHMQSLVKWWIVEDLSIGLTDVYCIHTAVFFFFVMATLKKCVWCYHINFFVLHINRRQWRWKLCKKKQS